MRVALTTFAITALLASSALASTLQTLPGTGKVKPSLLWDVPEAAAFLRGNDLWLVTATTTPLVVNIPQEHAQALGLISQEKLEVRGGQGVRLTFNHLPGIEALKQDAGFEFDITTKPAPVQQLLTIKRGQQDLNWTAPQAGKMLRAFSPQTKETYPVLTATALAGQRKAEVTSGVYLLPTTLGAVMVNRQGLAMTITGNSTEGFSLTHLKPDAAAGNSVAPVGTYGHDLAELLNYFPLAKGRQSSFVSALTQAQNAVTEAQRVATKLLAPQPSDIAPAPLKPVENTHITAEEVAAITGPNSETSPAEKPATTELLPTPTLAVSTTTAESLAKIAQRYAPRPFAAAQRDAVNAYVMAKTDEERHQAILRWAEMMFSFERYAEVMGLLQTLPQDSSTQLPLLTEARLMEVAASLMLGRVADADRIIKTITQNSPQLQLWQAALNVEQGVYTEAMTLFRQYADALSDYPKPVRRQLEVWALTAAYEAENYADLLPQAQVILDRDSQFALPQVALLQAKALIKQGKPELARPILVNLQEKASLQVKTAADVVMTYLKLDNGDITLDQAFEALERARFAWRGDKSERDLTFDLANLYLKNSRYLEALELFKYYTVVFPKGEQTTEAARQMTEVFNQLFTTDLAEQVLDPLTQLALYYEFRELTPPGPQGDTIMKRVVRKLADTSLYPRAIELLERLITFRLQNEVDKAEAGLTLAELHYANRSMEEGLKALQITTTKGILPTQLLEKRQVLQARLLYALGRQDEATQVMASFNTKPADYLRATMAWSGNNYPEVTRLLAPYFTNRESAADWQTDDHVALMQLALAYALARQPEDLARLYTNFTQEIALLKLDGAFQFLRDLAGEKAQTPEGQDLWQNLLKALGTVKNFEDFYDQFREMRYTRKPAETASAASAQ